MENRAIFIAYLVTWCVFLAATHIWSSRKRLPLAGVLALHAVPSGVAVVMTYVFLIAGSDTVAQFSAGSESGMALWSLWVSLWPILLLGTAISGVVCLVWTIVACLNRSDRKWLPVTVAAVLMAVFALFTVAANFPDA